MHFSTLFFANIIAGLSPLVTAIGAPMGFAAGVTGGGSATMQTPTSTTQLQQWLADSTPRVILLTSVMDFTNFFGNTTSAVCNPWSCSPNPQQMINSANNWCSGQATTNANYYNSGTTNSFYLQVGPNKTLLGKGANAGIKGAGLRMSNGVSNIIIQNIRITDLNARYVWGGDAISIDGASRIWIDHNYINRIGRQFFVSGFGAATQVTFSNNIFDGTSDFSTGCDGHQYWIGLIAGSGDTMTLYANYFHNTAGRGPHSGTLNGVTPYQTLHLVNNYYNSVTGHAVDSAAGSIMLVEGNYFSNVNQPSTNGAGAEYFMLSSMQVSSCGSSLGRTCQINVLNGTIGSTKPSKQDAFVLSTMAGQSAVKGLSVMAASAVPNFVLANAGPGKIN